MSRGAKVLAPAKVNLVLRVLGRRSDGYHEIDTLFQAVDLWDEIEVELGGEGVELGVDGPDLGPVTENLAYRAAVRLIDEVAPGTGARVRLTKRTPVGAGLGGGSSDAAAVLRALGVLLDVHDAPRLARVGAELGSDVPFFLGASPLARGRGRGEVLEAMEPLEPADLVLVSPPVHVSTGPAYAALREVRGGQGFDERPFPARPASWSGVETVVENDFEPVIAAAHGEIGQALSALRAEGGSMVMMSGSGSTCFGRFTDRSEATRVAEALETSLGWPCRAVRTLSSFPPVERS